MDRLTFEKTIGSAEIRRNISFSFIISKIRDVFERYYATIAEKEQYIKGLMPENWKDPDFDIEKKLESINGPLIEVAGPTEGGYSIIDMDSLGNKIYVSNLTKGCPISKDGKTVNYFGKVDFQADAKQLPFQEGKIGAVFCSCLGKVGKTNGDLLRERMENVLLREKAIEEAMRVLEPGGLIVIDNFVLEDMKMAEHLGFVIKQKSVDARLPEYVRCSFIGEKPSSNPTQH